MTTVGTLYSSAARTTALDSIGGNSFDSTIPGLLQQAIVAVGNNGGGGGGGSTAWGAITGTLSNQTDLQAALDLKASLSGDTFTGTVVAPALRTSNAIFPTRTLELTTGAGVQWSDVNGSGFSVVIRPDAPSANRTLNFNPNGNFVSTADVGTVTDAMLAGSITPSKVTGTAAILGANTFTAAQTIGAGTLATAALSLSQTWNSVGTTCRGFDVAVTNTNAAAASTLMRLCGGAAGVTEKMLVTQDARVCAEVGGAFPQFSGIGHTGTGMRVAADRVDLWLSGGVLATFQSGSLALNNLALSFGTGNSILSHASNVVTQVNGTTAQKFRVSKTTSGSQYIELDATGTNLINTTYALGDGAAAQAGTLTNAPIAGNPTKWIPINDNGTTRHIPVW